MPKKKVVVKPITKYGFTLADTSITYGGEIVGRYEEGNFFPSKKGQALGLVWMIVHKPKEVVFHLNRQLEAIKNPPKKFFRKAATDA
jgi:hypothetical protein